MPIYIYKGNSQISTNAVRNDKAVKAIYAKEQGKDAVCVWGIDTSIPYDQMFAYSIVNNKINITGLESNVKSNYITIPNKISDKLVTSIETAAFRDQNKILSIIAIGISGINLLLTLILSAKDVREAMIMKFHM